MADEWVNAQLGAIQDQEADRVLMVMLRRIDGEHEAVESDVLRAQLVNRTRRLQRITTLPMVPISIALREYRLVGRALAQMEQEHYQ